MKSFLKQNAGLIIVILAIVLVWYFYFRNKKTESSFGAVSSRVGVSRGSGIVNTASPDCNKGNQSCIKRGCGATAGMHCHNKPVVVAAPTTTVK